MKRLRPLLRVLAALLLVVLTIVAVRTATWRPPLADDAPPPLAEAIAIDAARAALHLAEAIRIPTVSHRDPADDDLAAWAHLHTWLQTTYPRLHAAATRDTVADRTLIYTWIGADPRQPPIVLMAHQDVVPVPPGSEADWQHPPFAGTIVDDVVWGRGALDDKGSLVAIMEAAETLLARGFVPSRTIYFVFGHDEEVAGTGAAAAAAWFVARDIRPEFVLDEGGLALTKNPVTGKPIAVINVAEKGYATLEISASAPGGHASMPPATTAVHTLAQAVDRLATSPLPLSFDGPGADMVRVLASDAGWPLRAVVANTWLSAPLLARRLAQSPTSAAMFRTTLAPTMLAASPQDNVLAARATATFNVRLHPRDTLDAVLAHATAAVGDLPVELRFVGRADPASPVSSTTSPAFRLLAALARASTDAPVAPSISNGATDARHFAPIAADIYRFLPVLIDDAELATLHGVDERLSVANLARAAGFYARLLATAAG